MSIRRLFGIGTLLWFLLAGFAPAQELETCSIERKDDHLAITVLLSATEEQNTVQIPTEGVVFSVAPPRVIEENDLFRSGLSLDLNGDGDTADSFPLRQEEGEFYIADLQVRPFTEGLNLQRTGEAEVYRLALGAPTFTVYQVSPRLTAGLEFGGTPARIEEHPAPFLQVLLVEPCQGPAGDPQLRLSGSPRTVYAYEPGPGSPGPRWSRIQWLALAPNETHRFRISGKGDGLLILAVNKSPSQGLRERVFEVFEPVSLPPSPSLR